MKTTFPTIAIMAMILCDVCISEAAQIPEQTVHRQIHAIVSGEPSVGDAPLTDRFRAYMDFANPQRSFVEQILLEYMRNGIHSTNETDYSVTLLVRAGNLLAELGSTNALPLFYEMTGSQLETIRREGIRCMVRADPIGSLAMANRIVEDSERFDDLDRRMLYEAMIEALKRFPELSAISDWLTGAAQRDGDKTNICLIDSELSVISDDYKTGAARTVVQSRIQNWSATSK